MVLTVAGTAVGVEKPRNIVVRSRPARRFDETPRARQSALESRTLGGSVVARIAVDGRRGAGRSAPGGPRWGQRASVEERCWDRGAGTGVLGSQVPAGKLACRSDEAGDRCRCHRFAGRETDVLAGMSHGGTFPAQRPTCGPPAAPLRPSCGPPAALLRPSCGPPAALLRPTAQPAQRPTCGPPAAHLRPTAQPAQRPTCGPPAAHRVARPAAHPAPAQGTPSVNPAGPRHARVDVVLVTRRNRRDLGDCLACRGHCGQDQAFS